MAALPAHGPGLERLVMQRSAASRAEAAAAALDAYLRDRPQPPAGEAVIQPQECPLATPLPSQQPGPEVARNAASNTASRPPLQLAHTDWLHHRLCITGADPALDRFRQAAAGAGTIPWHLDLGTLEEDWFHLLANPASRELSLAGSRRLAGQLRGAVERRHALAIARVGQSRACPLDLHALVPVPSAILRLGPDHSDALAWLWQHWGTTEALRHVVLQRVTKDGKSAAVAGEEVLRFDFWSADWTPWRAVARMGSDWPMLRFAVQPDYATI